MEISQKPHVRFHEIAIVDSCRNVWVCVVLLLKVCVMFEVTDLCQSAQTQSSFAAVSLFQLLINLESMETLCVWMLVCVSSRG